MQTVQHLDESTIDNLRTVKNLKELESSGVNLMKFLAQDYYYNALTVRQSVPVWQMIFLKAIGEEKTDLLKFKDFARVVDFRWVYFNTPIYMQVEMFKIYAQSVGEGIGRKLASRNVFISGFGEGPKTLWEFMLDNSTDYQRIKLLELPYFAKVIDISYLVQEPNHIVAKIEALVKSGIEDLSDRLLETGGPYSYQSDIRVSDRVFDAVCRQTYKEITWDEEILRLLRVKEFARSVNIEKVIEISGKDPASLFLMEEAGVNISKALEANSRREENCTVREYFEKKFGTVEQLKEHPALKKTESDVHNNPTNDEGERIKAPLDVSKISNAEGILELAMKQPGRELELVKALDSALHPSDMQTYLRKYVKYNDIPQELWHVLLNKASTRTSVELLKVKNFAQVVKISYLPSGLGDFFVEMIESLDESGIDLGRKLRLSPLNPFPPARTIADQILDTQSPNDTLRLLKIKQFAECVDVGEAIKHSGNSPEALQLLNKAGIDVASELISTINGEPVWSRVLQNCGEVNIEKMKLLEQAAFQEVVPAKEMIIDDAYDSLLDSVVMVVNSLSLNNDVIEKVFLNIEDSDSAFYLLNYFLNHEVPKKHLLCAIMPAISTTPFYCFDAPFKKLVKIFNLDDVLTSSNASALRYIEEKVIEGMVLTQKVFTSCVKASLEARESSPEYNSLFLGNQPDTEYYANWFNIHSVFKGEVPKKAPGIDQSCGLWDMPREVLGQIGYFLSREEGMFIQSFGRKIVPQEVAEETKVDNQIVPVPDTGGDTVTITITIARELYEALVISIYGHFDQVSQTGFAPINHDHTLTTEDRVVDVTGDDEDLFS